MEFRSELLDYILCSNEVCVTQSRVYTSPDTILLSHLHVK